MAFDRVQGLEERILNDEEYRVQENTESRIRYILKRHTSIAELKEHFLEREQIVGSKRKSAPTSKDYFDNGKTIYNTQHSLPNPDYKDALSNLNKAVMYAPHHATEFNTLEGALEWRAKTLQEMGKRDQSRLNTKHVSDLKERPEFIPKVDNKHILEVHKYCELQENEEFGRHMKASDVIQLNSHVVKEKVQYRVLLSDSLSKYCFNCFEPINISSAYPCINCVECIFCGQTCHDTANVRSYNNFHKFDCGIAGYMIEKYQPQWSLGYRTLTSLGYRNVRDLNTFINENSGPFDMNRFIVEQKQITGEITKNRNKEQFKAFLSFVDHIDEIRVDTMLWIISIAFEIALLVDQINALNMTDVEDFILLTAMLVKFFRKTASNIYDINDIKGKIKTGHCIAIVSSMFNHSCNSNTDWEVSNQYQVLKARKPIPKNQQITISYGPNAKYGVFDEKYKNNFHKRQHELRDFIFSCNCEICSTDKLRFIPLYCEQNKCGGTVYYGNENFADNLQLRCVDCWKTNIASKQIYIDQCENLQGLMANLQAKIDLIYVKGTPWVDETNLLNQTQPIMKSIEDIVKPEWHKYKDMKEKLNAAHNYVWKDEI